MKCAMLVVSEVLTMVLPSGLTAMPSGSTPVGICAMHLARGHVDHRHHVVVLVRHVERIAGDVQGEGLGIGTGRQIADDLQRLGVDDLDGVVVARADQDRLPSAVIVMPRGRWPTWIVLVTVHVSVSITETVLPFSLETKATNADAGDAWARNSAAVSRQAARGKRCKFGPHTSRGVFVKRRSLASSASWIGDFAA